MGMFIRSKDGKHLAEAASVDLEGKKILVNGNVFGEYEDEEEAEEAFAALCRECCDMETFYDLSGEIEDDDDWDDDEDDEDDDDDDGDGIRFLSDFRF